MASSTKRSPNVWSYEDIDAGGEALRSIFQDQNIKISEGSTLSKLLRQASRLSNEWRSVELSDHGALLVDAGHANRIIQAVISAADDPGSIPCMRRIAKKDVNLSQRVVSSGKDALWELEFLAMLRSKGIQARLGEPDIVASFLFGEYSVACKKVYSDACRSVEAQLRAGAAQLSRSGRPGIIALNIDDLIPANALMTARTVDAAMQTLEQSAKSFLDKHQPKAERFVKDGRCDGILVSLTVPSDIETSSPTFNQLASMTLWSLETISDQAGARIEHIRAAFQNASS